MIDYYLEKLKRPVPMLGRVGFLFICLVLFSAFSLNAQTVQIKGVVTEAGTNETLAGVNIVIEGTTTGVTTDIDGKYTITVPENGILVFSFIGYVVERIPVQGKTEVNVTLVPDMKKLDEVVVIGYGTVKKKDLTGSVSSISGDKLKDIPVSSAAEALTGKLAGVQVTTTEGSPDAEIKIRVRGGGSITGNNTPLYVVDGFPVDRISDIPPSDIQSYDVLKDASSTAIYGARGANGVVIITTKTAKEGKISASYNGYYGVKTVPKMLDVLSPYEFVKWQYEQAVLQNEVSDQYESYFGSYDDIDLYKSMGATDWQDVVFGNTGKTQSHSFNINGGSDKLSFAASYNRVDEKTIMLGSDFTRDNVNLKMNATPLRWLKTNFAVRYSDASIRGAGANDVTGTEKSTSDSRLKNAVIYSPFALRNMTAPDDDPESSSGLYSPLVTIPDNDRDRDRKTYNINGDVSIDLSKNLVLKSEIGFDYGREIDNRYFGLTTYFVTSGDASIKNKPAAQLMTKDNTSFRNANTLTFSKRIENHNLAIMAGEETLTKRNNSLTNWIDGFPTFFDAEKAWAFTTEGHPISATNYYSPDDKLLSFFGRANYDFKGKYLLSATFRADGSSKFRPGNQWGYFPSAAAAWRISDENFMKITEPWLSNLKLRFSYGTAGNNNIIPLAYMQTYSSYATTYLPGSLATSYWAAPPTMSNNDLMWETTVTRNLGLDIGLFKNRFTGSVELYKNNTKGLLIDYTVAGSGYTTQLRNIGRTSNRGIEISANVIALEKKDIHLEFGFNISLNRNKVEELGGMPNISANSAWTSDAQASNDFRVIEGMPVGLMYGYITDGFYKVDDFNWNGTSWVLKNRNQTTPDNAGIAGPSWGPGALKLKDLNGDGYITDDDRTIIGDATPKHTGGFTISAVVKGFDFSANLNWVYGNNIYNANRIEFTTANKYNYRNMLNDVNSSVRWTNIDPATGARVTDPTQLAQLNANATIWSPGLGRYAFHSWAVEDGSFLRLNNVTIGYSIPQRLLTKFYIKQLRFYVSGYNLFVWTKYSGYDPEVDTRRKTSLTPGVDYSAYPRSRSYNFGINLTF
jgi:TonB-dependent starch-binding outer membrane protein SusC